MTIDAIIVLALVVVAIVLFATERLPVDLVALIIMATLLGSGIISLKEGLFGFSNPATVTIGAMFVLSAGLFRTGVVSGYPLERVRRFQEAAPRRLISAYQLNLGHNNYLSSDALRRHFEVGDFAVLGEIENQYAGIAPGDERMEPYWALAEELDIPVALHLGEGYPGALYLGSPKYRVRLGSPLLEDVLVAHPKLRIYVMHYGSPLIDEMIAVLYTYPQVYVDIGGNV